MTFDDIPLDDYETEVFCECGAWKNYIELEDELSLQELLRLYEGAMERQNRMLRTVAAAMGAEISDGPSTSSSGSAKPAYMIDPEQGGEATPAFGEDEIAELPINIGYSIINNDA